MDWFSTYHAHVNYHQKKITFNLEEVSEYVFEGMNKLSITIISTIKATRLLRNGCRELLATVIDKKDDEVKIENIVVVR